MMARQSRNWAGTLHGVEGDALRAFVERAEGLAARGVYQEEKCPETGRIHLQFALGFSDPKRGSWMKKNVCDKTHWTACNGSWDDQVRYCTKEESRVEDGLNGSWGAAPAPGKRTDLEAVHAMIKDNAEMSVNDLRKLISDAYPGEYAKYHAGLDRMIVLNRPRPDFALPALRPHQQELADLLDVPADDRKIFWVYDPIGNTGKTSLMRHYLTKGKAISLSGKVADMAHAYDGQKIVFFDLSRTSSETCSYLYDFAEKLKNGVCFSGKYDSHTKQFAPPHVVFLANFPYPEGVWSADRKKVLQWSQPLAPVFNPPKD